MIRDAWAIEGGKLVRNGTPVARLYANALTADEQAVMLAKLNRRNGR